MKIRQHRYKVLILSVFLFCSCAIVAFAAVQYSTANAAGNLDTAVVTARQCRFVSRASDPDLLRWLLRQVNNFAARIDGDPEKSPISRECQMDLVYEVTAAESGQQERRSLRTEFLDDSARVGSRVHILVDGEDGGAEVAPPRITSTVRGLTAAAAILAILAILALIVFVVI